MEQRRVRLGELLVGANLITSEQLKEALALQAQDGRKLGALLVESGYVTETQVTQVLSQQLSVPWVSLHHIDFSRQLLNLVQRELAEHHCLIPIFVRRSRNQRETLYIAMEDPTDAEACAEVELFAGLPVQRMIAPPSEIRAAIRVYYGGESERPPAPPERTEPKSSAKQSEAKAAQTDAERRATEAKPPAAPPREAPRPPMPSTPDTDERGPASAPVQVRETSMPSPKADGSSVEMVTLTLLDGTQLNLPAAAKPGPKSNVSAPNSPGEMLTASDLVAALRAQASGTDVSEVLGSEVNWQRVCAALLSVLLRKHLIADWEFVEELQRSGPPR